MTQLHVGARVRGLFSNGGANVRATGTVVALGDDKVTAMVVLDPQWAREDPATGGRERLTVPVTSLEVVSEAPRT